MGICESCLKTQEDADTGTTSSRKNRSDPSSADSKSRNQNVDVWPTNGTLVRDQGSQTTPLFSKDATTEVDTYSLLLYGISEDRHSEMSDTNPNENIRRMHRNPPPPNPIKEEAYAFVGCLYRLRERYNVQGFNPDFTKKMFGPYILNKLFRWNGDIKEAVKLWRSDPTAAEEQYGHISKWDVSRVTNMNSLFDGTWLNDDISAWDVSRVTTMYGMFSHTRRFNQNIGAWDVSSVTTMKLMFNCAESFNQNIGAWDVSSVTDMDFMFYHTESFNQNIGAWDVSSVTTLKCIFNGARKLSDSNENAFWNAIRKKKNKKT